MALGNWMRQAFGALAGSNYRWSPEAEEVVGDLLRALRRKRGFGLFFVQCSPAQGQQVMAAIQERLPQKRLAEFELERDSKTLYGELLESYRAEPFEVACVTGVEQALYDYEDTKRIAGWSSEEIYNYSWKGLPPLLSHLNRQREAFEANLPVALLFLVPGFVIDYFVQRAPDFFDWRSGFFRLSPRIGRCGEKLFEELTSEEFEEYKELSSEKRLQRILQIKDLLKSSDLEKEQQAQMLREQGRLFSSGDDFEQSLDCYSRAIKFQPDCHETFRSKGIVLRNLERYEEAIAAYDTALNIKPDNHKVLNNKGIALYRLERYEEAIAAYDAALIIKPDNHYALKSKGFALRNLERYEEAIAAYDAALIIKPDFHEALNIKGNALRNLERYEEAIAAYDAALNIKPDLPRGAQQQRICAR